MANTIPEKIYFSPYTGTVVDKDYPGAIEYVPSYLIRQKEDIIHTLNKAIGRLKHERQRMDDIASKN
jgi:hypothetical protein